MLEATFLCSDTQLPPEISLLLVGVGQTLGKIVPLPDRALEIPGSVCIYPLSLPLQVKMHMVLCPQWSRSPTFPSSLSWRSLAASTPTSLAPWGPRERVMPGESPWSTPLARTSGDFTHRSLGVPRGQGVLDPFPTPAPCLPPAFGGHRLPDCGPREPGMPDLSEILNPWPRISCTGLC